MTNFQTLLTRTRDQAAGFQSIPLVRHAVQQGASRALYLDFLGEAYHHVKHTCPLLATALGRCGDQDSIYRNALFEYLHEEQGHEAWIIDDIRFLGGDGEGVMKGRGCLATRTMVAYAYHVIERISPYCLLGMVHVLEGMSAALATAVAGKIRQSLGQTSANGGFSYLTSHGALDQEHVGFFAGLVDSIRDERLVTIIVESARDFYALYGNIFRDLGERHGVIA